MLKNYLSKNRQILFVLLWFCLWASIGTYPVKKNIFYDTISLNDIILQLRLYTPLIVFGIILFLVSLKKISINFYNRKWISIFLFLFITQGIGLFLNKERSFEPISWVLVFYSLILCFVVSNLNMINLKKIHFVNLFFLVAAFILFINPVYKSYFNLNENQLFMYNFSNWNENSFGSPNVRVTGLARYCLIIIIFLYAYLITNRSSKFYYTILSLVLLFFFILNIWMLQSRLIIGASVIVFCSSLILKNKSYNNNQLITVFLLICVYVYGASLITQNTKKSLILNKVKEQITKDYQNNKNLENIVDKTIIVENENILQDEINKQIEQKDKKLEEKKETRFSNFTSSGRTQIWTELIFAFNKFKIFGYGIQADRFLLIDPDRNLSTNASNAILYTLVSGGYFAIVIFIILLIKSVILNYKILRLSYNGVNLNFFDVLSYLQINFFLIRQFFENSFAVFSVDLILFISCFFYLTRRFEK